MIYMPYQRIFAIPRSLKYPPIYFLRIITVVDLVLL